MPPHRTAHLSLPTALLVLCVLFLHARYITLVTEPTTKIPAGFALRSVYARHGNASGELPDLFIFRRTKKTASTSMANALLNALIPYGYEPVAMKNFEISTHAANAFVRAAPRRLIIVNHNQITRSAHPLVSSFDNISTSSRTKNRNTQPRNYQRQSAPNQPNTIDEIANRVVVELASQVVNEEDQFTPIPSPESDDEDEEEELGHQLYFDEPHARGRVVIADTIRDGFQQITSYCRHMRGFTSCNGTMISCIQSRLARAQMLYRFAGNDRETADTYIDLPLSSAHPALSTTVLRSVYPDMEPLRIDRYNARRYACRASQATELKEAYDAAGFGELDRHVDLLRKRMLLIAGYPTEVRARKKGGQKGVTSTVKTTELLDAAEEVERRKRYAGVKMYARAVSPYSKSAVIAQLLARPMAWGLDEGGRLVLTQRRKEILVDAKESGKARGW